MTLPFAPVDSSSLLCPAFHYDPIVALRPRSGQRLPADPARKQASALTCAALRCLAMRSFLPNAVTRWIAPPIWATKFAAHARKQAVHCHALRCHNLLCNALLSIPFCPCSKFMQPFFQACLLQTLSGYSVRTWAGSRQALQALTHAQTHPVHQTRSKLRG